MISAFNAVVCRICRWCEVGFYEGWIDTSVRIERKVQFLLRRIPWLSVEVITASDGLPSSEFEPHQHRLHVPLCFPIQGSFFDLCFGTRDAAFEELVREG